MGDAGTGWGLASLGASGLCLLFAAIAQREGIYLDKVQVIGDLLELHALKGKLPLIVAVEGVTCCSAPLKCGEQQLPAVMTMTSRALKTEKKGPFTGEWLPHTSQLGNPVIAEADWAVTDASKLKLPVIAARDAHTLPWILLSETFEAAAQTLSLLLKDTMLGTRTIGILKSEHYVPVDAPVTCIGEIAAVPTTDRLSKIGSLVKGNKGTVVVMRKPANGPFRVVNKSFSALKQDYTRLSRTCYYLAFGFAAVGTCIFVHKWWCSWQRKRATRRALQDIRQRESQQRQQRQQRGEVNAHDEAVGVMGVDEAQTLKCVVCWQHAPQMVFANCGHLCVCAACAAQLDRCPVCRSRGGCIRVYSIGAQS